MRRVLMTLSAMLAFGAAPAGAHHSEGHVYPYDCDLSYGVAIQSRERE